MSDLPGTGAPGRDSEPYVPSGVRRSTYTPPAREPRPEGAALDDAAYDDAAYDDDALAEALAAQVAPYTAPIPITRPAPPSRDPEPVIEGPVTEEPVIEEPVLAEPSREEPPAPDAEVDAGVSSLGSFLDTSTSSTLAAIERLENELRRRAEEAQTGAPTPSVAEPGAVESPESTDPPALVEPPPPAQAFGPPSTPSVALPPPADAPAVDAPPVEPPAVERQVDFAHLPPPIGLTPAPLPPYDPTSEIAVAVPPGGVPVDLPPPSGEPAGSLPPPDAEASDAFFVAPGASAEASAADDDDVVDEVDRAYIDRASGAGSFAAAPITVDATGSATVPAPPSQPIPTVRLADGEAALVDEQPETHPALVVETAGPEPTALDLRAGRAARLFWLWFAANSSIISLSLGAILLGLGMSLRQSLVAILIGVALSFLPLGLVTLAGKWSGQPTMIVSRATFGVIGNVVPAVLAVASRVFWGGALLWVLATGVARVLVDAGLDAGLGELVWTFVVLGVGFALAFVVASFGYGLVARVQLVLSIITGLLVVGVIAITFPQIDIGAAQSIDDGPWTLLITGAVLVFSFVGLAWVHSSADVARYQRTDSDGGSTMLWATFGATLPAFVLFAWGALLAASNPLIAEGLATNPLYTIAALLPLWYPAPLIAALSLGLLSGVVLTIYSGGFALQALGLRARRSGTTVIAGALVLIAAFVLCLLAGDARGLIRDIATTIAVPIAAWAGIFGAEIMIRRRGFHSASLVRGGGVYPSVRWVNLAGLVVISVIGFGFTASTLPGLDWQGYLLPLLGLPDGDPLLTSDIGVLGALVLGIVLPLATAVPAIRRQERALID